MATDSIWAKNLPGGYAPHPGGPDLTSGSYLDKSENVGFWNLPAIPGAFFNDGFEQELTSGR